MNLCIIYNDPPFVYTYVGEEGLAVAAAKEEKVAVPKVYFLFHEF